MQKYRKTFQAIEISFVRNSGKVEKSVFHEKGTFPHGNDCTEFTAGDRSVSDIFLNWKNKNADLGNIASQTLYLCNCEICLSPGRKYQT